MHHIHSQKDTDLTFLAASVFQSPVRKKRNIYRCCLKYTGIAKQKTIVGNSPQHFWDNSKWNFIVLNLPLTEGDSKVHKMVIQIQYPGTEKRSSTTENARG